MLGQPTAISSLRQCKIIFAKILKAKINQKLTDAEFEKLSEWFVAIQLENKMQFVISFCNSTQL